MALLVISFVIGSWVVVSQVARQQPSEAPRVAVPSSTPKDVSTAYKDVVYKVSGRDGSVIWKVALKQAYKPDRIIGSYVPIRITRQREKRGMDSFTDEEQGVFCHCG